MRESEFLFRHSHVTANQLKSDGRLEIADKRVERFCRSIAGFHFNRKNLAVLFNHKLKRGAVSLLVVMERITVLYQRFGNEILIDAAPSTLMHILGY